MTTQEKMNVIATVFGAKTGTKKHRCCTGKWKGTRDYSILFDKRIILRFSKLRLPHPHKRHNITGICRV
jgi:mRNA-degrading endonuclease YafQ of YafQ-DinJ toxin-antitoxin module